MSPLALLLVLLAALCHSAWNLIVKTDGRRLEIQSGALLVGTLMCAPELLFYSPRTLSPRACALLALAALFVTACVLSLCAAHGRALRRGLCPHDRGQRPRDARLLGSARENVAGEGVIVSRSARDQRGRGGAPWRGWPFPAAPARVGRPRGRLLPRTLCVSL